MLVLERTLTTWVFTIFFTDEGTEAQREVCCLNSQKWYWKFWTVTQICVCDRTGSSLHSFLSSAEVGRMLLNIIIIIKVCSRRGTWVTQSIKRPTLCFGSGHGLTGCGFEPHVWFCNDGMEPAWDSVSYSLLHSASPPLMLSLSLKINKWTLKKVCNGSWSILAKDLFLYRYYKNGSECPRPNYACQGQFLGYQCETRPTIC